MVESILLEAGDYSILLDTTLRFDSRIIYYAFYTATHHFRLKGGVLDP